MILMTMLKYLIEHFFKRWKRTLNGKINWQGEDDGDQGIIHVKDNKVRAIADVIEITSPEPDWS